MYRAGGEQAGLTLYSYSMGEPDWETWCPGNDGRLEPWHQRQRVYPWQTRGGAEARRRRALHLVTTNDAVRVTLPTRQMSLPKGVTSLEE